MGIVTWFASLRPVARIDRPRKLARPVGHGSPRVEQMRRAAEADIEAVHGSSEYAEKRRKYHWHDDEPHGFAAS